MENILEITCTGTINLQHFKDFEKFRAFEDVTIFDYSEIISRASTIWVNDVKNCKTDSCFSTQWIWHSECTDSPKNCPNTKLQILSTLQPFIKEFLNTWLKHRYFTANFKSLFKILTASCSKL